MGAQMTSTGMTTADILHARDRFLFPAMRHYYADGLALAEGEGVRVRDAEGVEYLDLFGGILTTSVGHCHPRVIEAVTTQMRRLGHVSTLYATEAHVEAARRIAEIAPGALRRTFFTNSGSEAIETALAMACLVTGRSEIIALRGAYHGRSFLGMSVTAHPTYRPLASPVGGIKHALAPNPYRCPFKQPCDESCVRRHVEDLEELILTTTSGKPAALLVETIQGVSGYVTPPAGYFGAVAEVIRRHGGLLIVDEVQSGLGRTGGRWFGIEHWDVVPDIMVMAKGIANGFPAAATTTTDELAHAWKGTTISTFGGNPVAMAALCATLDVLREEDAPANAQVCGERLRGGLSDLQRRYPWIGDVRGMGLMLGMELVRDPVTKEPDAPRARALMEAARRERLLVGAGGLHGNVIRIGPSLLIDASEIDEALEKLSAACAALSG